jgi:hypothetical protein
MALGYCKIKDTQGYTVDGRQNLTNGSSFRTLKPTSKSIKFEEFI